MIGQRDKEVIDTGNVITDNSATMLVSEGDSADFGGDAASWLVMQTNYDLKTLSTLTDVERQEPIRSQLAA